MDVGIIGQYAISIGGMILTVLLTAGLAIGGVVGFKKWKRYQQYDCVIFERDGFGQLRQTRDKAGVFVDSTTKNKLLYLRKARIGLSPDIIPYIQSNKGKQTIYLYKTGLANFHYINIKIADPKINFTVGEEDVNWAYNAYERSKKFAASTLLMYMPFILLAFVSIIILILFVYLFKAMPETMASVSEAAKHMAAYKSGTTVITGG